MYQQINLYQDSLIEKREPLQAQQALAIFLLSLVVLVVVGVLLFMQKAELQRQVADLDRQQQNLSGRMIELEEQLPEPQPNALLKEKIASLTAKIQGQREALKHFSEQDVAKNNSLLTSLDSLARYRLKGVWLKSISLTDSGANVQLQGSALKAEQVPVYLDLLGENKVFNGKVFARLAVNRLEEQADQVDFSLSSRGDGAQ